MCKLRDAWTDEDETHKKACERNSLEEPKRRQSVQHGTDEDKDHKVRVNAPTDVVEAAHGGRKAGEIFLNQVDLESCDSEQKRRQDYRWRQRTSEIGQAPQNKGSASRTAYDDDRQALCRAERRPLSSCCQLVTITGFRLNALAPHAIPPAAMVMAILLLGCLLHIARPFAKSQFRAGVRRTLHPKQKTAQGRDL